MDQRIGVPPWLFRSNYEAKSSAFCMSNRMIRSSIGKRMRSLLYKQWQNGPRSLWRTRACFKMPVGVQLRNVSSRKLAPVSAARLTSRIFCGPQQRSEEHTPELQSRLQL